MRFILPDPPPPQLSCPSGARRRLQHQLLIEFPVNASVRNLPRSTPAAHCIHGTLLFF